MTLYSEKKWLEGKNKELNSKLDKQIKLIDLKENQILEQSKIIQDLDKDLAFHKRENYFNAQRMNDYQQAFEIADRYYNNNIGMSRQEVNVDDVNYEYRKEIDEVLPKFRQDVVTGEELTTKEEMRVGRKNGSAIK